MGQTAVIVLRQRLCRWHKCNALFHICVSCDRGQCYCSDSCRQHARRKQRREANRRHRQTLEARLDQRDRQRAYRLRLAKRSVMDQGSSAKPTSPKIIPPVVLPPDAVEESGKPMAETGRIHDRGVACCIFCGRQGSFVNPFHQRR